MMTLDDAVAHQPHPWWPRSQGGGPCECRTCSEARRVKGAAADETRRAALARGMDQSVADRAAIYRLHSPGVTLDAAIALAQARAASARAWGEEVRNES